MELGHYRQQVPRPAGHRRGEPAPWEALPEAARAHVPLAALLPALAPVAPPTAGPDRAAAVAAVIIPVFERAGEATLVLIRRAQSLGRDPGHLAFPGGRIEPGEGPLDAALREAEEEVALGRGEIARLAEFTTVQRPSDGQVVVAFLALLGDPPALVANPAEVDACFEVPLSTLLRDGVGWSEHWSSAPAGERTVRFFAAADPLGDNLIWGMTARIIWHLLERVAPTAATRPVGPPAT